MSRQLFGFPFPASEMGQLDLERFSLPTAQGQRRILLLAPLLERPLVAAGISAAAATHLILANAGHEGLGCVFHDLTGLPCPGCGLTQACLAFFHGEWRNGFLQHPFAPFFLIALILIFSAAVLPSALRIALVRWSVQFEHRTAAGLALLTAMIAFWLGRIPWA